MPDTWRSTITTIVHVANLAGVSTSTVSHVLNGTRHVEPATRQRVLDAIEKTSYRRDALARTLRRSQTESIGLIVSDAGEPAFAEMVHGVERAAADRNLILLLANSAESSAREERAVQALLERRVDGLLLARAADSDDRVIDLLRNARTRTVLIDRVYESVPLHQVAAENHRPMVELVAHLHGQGHRRFCVVAGDTRVPSLAERLGGFEDSVRKLGLDPRSQVVASGTVADVEQTVAQSARQPGRPTAYIACSTVLAAATLVALRQCGLTTPADLAFATFDGFNQPDLFEPRLTTVRQLAFEVGRAAVEMLEATSGDAGEDGRADLQHAEIRRLPQRVELRDSTEAYRFAG